MAVRRPRVLLACVADRQVRDRPARAIEFVFPDGSVGVLSFYTLADGTNVIDPTVLAPGTVVYGAGTSVTALGADDDARRRRLRDAPDAGEP